MRQRLSLNQASFHALLAVLALCGIALVGLGTRWGPALSDDSFTYITSARNLVAGEGFGAQTVSGQIIPLAHYPPLLSLILAGFELIGVDAVVAARWLNAGLFALSIATAGYAVLWMSGKRAFALLGALLMLLSETMIGVHAAAMSEGLYLWLSLLGLLLLARSRRSGRRSALVVAAAAIGLAFIARYVGLALIAGGALWLLVDPARGLRRRLGDAAVFAAVGAAPMLAWVARNLLTIGDLTDRTLDLYPVGWSFLRGIANVIFIWFIPGRFVHGNEVPIALALLVITAGAAVLGLRGKPAGGRLRRMWDRLRAARMETLLGLYALSFLAIFLISKSLFDPAIYVDNRLLSPLHLALLILVVVALARVCESDSVLLRRGVPAVCGLLVAFYAYRTIDTVGYLYREGLGYTSRGWHGSDAIALVRRLDERTIYTNAVPAIYFWTGRTVNSMRHLETVKPALQSECAVLIVFDSIPLSLFDVTQQQVAEGLRRQERDLADVYYHPDCAAELAPTLDS